MRINIHFRFRTFSFLVLLQLEVSHYFFCVFIEIYEIAVYSKLFLTTVVFLEIFYTYVKLFFSYKEFSSHTRTHTVYMCIYTFRFTSAAMKAKVLMPV